jgi:hypothetical protein
MTNTVGTNLSANQDVSAFLDLVKKMPAPGSGGHGRLIFAMDATMSRQPTWDRALSIQSEMFAETKRAGGLDVQLVFFRGLNECRASKWVANPEALAKLITTVECRGGNTQVGKVLQHVIKETTKSKVNAVVYVGDALEENIDVLCQKAGEVGLCNVPIFMFQEGHDSTAERGFKEITRLTRGAYFKLDGNSPSILAELLRAVAAYAAGGRKALADKAKSGGASLLLLQQLG